jgi:hypothetical protein
MHALLLLGIPLLYALPLPPIEFEEAFVEMPPTFDLNRREHYLLIV